MVPPHGDRLDSCESLNPVNHLQYTILLTNLIVHFYVVVQEVANLTFPYARKCILYEVMLLIFAYG